MYVEDYNLKDGVLYAFVYPAKTIEIDTIDFEAFLKDTDKLAWCNDWNEGGNHHQITGQLDIYEYFEHTPYADKLADIKEYINKYY
jgi:hypothetical protein